MCKAKLPFCILEDCHAPGFCRRVAGGDNGSPKCALGDPFRFIPPTLSGNEKKHDGYHNEIVCFLLIAAQLFNIYR